MYIVYMKPPLRPAPRLSSPATASLSVATARQRLPALLAAAEAGVESVISRRGRPVAVLGPVTPHTARPRTPLTSLIGSGKSLWGRAGTHVRKARDEW